MDDRRNFMFLGRVVGTAIGWDMADEGLLLHGFVPAAGMNLPAGEVEFNYAVGTAAMIDDSGMPHGHVDLVTALKDTPPPSDIEGAMKRFYNGDY